MINPFMVDVQDNPLGLKCAARNTDRDGRLPIIFIFTIPHELIQPW